MKQPTIIAVAPTGARRTRQDHPHLPMREAEIAVEAAACLERGASVLHLHVRQPDGRHSLDAAHYMDAMKAVRREVGQRMVIQITTEAVGLYTPEQQAALVRQIRPEAVSLALRELAQDAAHEAEFLRLMAFMAHETIAAQLILYDSADLRRLHAMVKAGNMPPAGWTVLYVIGRYAQGQVSHPADLLEFLKEHSSSSMPVTRWMLCAFGPDESRALAAAALLGGDVRTGFENNLYLPDGLLASSNAALVEAVATPLRRLGLRSADADEVRTEWMMRG